MLDTVVTALVIPVFNGLDRLKDCLASLVWVREEAEVHLVVVDSGSTDGTLTFLSGEASWVVVVNVAGDAWWTAAVEAGCRRARTDLGAERICLLNHDCRWTHEGYAQLTKCLDAHPKDIVCSRVVDLRDGSPIFEGGRQRRDGSLTTRLPASRTRIPSGGSAIVQWCGGMGVMFSFRTYVRMGGFDARTFPHYFGDSDFCLRARDAGVRTRYCPDSVVVNDGASTGAGIPRDGATVSDLRRSLTSRRSFWNLRDNTVFYIRHRGILAPLALAHVYAEWAGIAGVRLVRGMRA